MLLTNKRNSGILYIVSTNELRVLTSKNNQGVDIVELNERKRQILRAIVDDYIRTAEPVGSSYILNKHNLGISSATIRNEMAYLEEMGYLDKPHTSAGRVPSSLGYRAYVDELMQRYTLTVSEIEKMRSSLKKSYVELGNILKDISNTVAHLTNYTTLISSPYVMTNKIKSIRLVPLDEKSFVMIVVSSGGIVKNTTITLRTDIDLNILERLGNYLNHTFCEKDIAFITESFINEQRQMLPVANDIINPVFDFLVDVIKSLVSFEVSAMGEANILNYPEFKNINRTKEFFDFIDNIDKEFIKDILKDDKINILIGDENPHLKELGLSMVISNYKINDSMMGGIAIIGPTRMDYSKVVATLDYLKNNLNKYLTDKGDDV